MRIGVFGGTFDPPHIGHLVAAGDAVETLKLDRLCFIPAAQQPLKLHAAGAPADHRLAMVRAMVAGDPRFEVDDVEVRRGGLSFTADTLRELRAGWRGPGEQALFLLVGADAAATLPKWREAGSIAELAEIVILTRMGSSEGLETGAVAGRLIGTRRIDISSTEIRDRVRSGRPIRGFVTDAVAAYIADTGLYR